MKRPKLDNGSRGNSPVTTPIAADMISLLGGMPTGGLTLTTSEYSNLRKLYGFVPEKPNERPPPPSPPVEADFKGDRWKYQSALDDHKRALEYHAKWCDPQRFMQAGADVNLVRHAESDGFRLVAWLAKYVEAGQDPLKTLIQMAIDSGFDVAPEDVEYAEGSDEDQETR